MQRFLGTTLYSAGIHRNFLIESKPFEDWSCHESSVWVPFANNIAHECSVHPSLVISVGEHLPLEDMSQVQL